MDAHTKDSMEIIMRTKFALPTSVAMLALVVSCCANAKGGGGSHSGGSHASGQHSTSSSHSSGSSTGSNSSSHAVKGYNKKDGTHVDPHHATNANNTKKDNYSSKPNVNPYTGKEGTKNADK